MAVLLNKQVSSHYGIVRTFSKSRNYLLQTCQQKTCLSGQNLFIPAHMSGYAGYAWTICCFEACVYIMVLTDGVLGVVMLRRKSAMLLISIAANGDVSGASMTVDSTGINTSHKHSLLHLRKI